LVGFVEGEGSFYLVSKDSSRIVPPQASNLDADGADNEFSLRHKTDIFILYQLKRLLHIPNKIEYDYTMNTYVLKTRNSRAIWNSFPRNLKG
jgi:hypothetical protein